MPIYINNRISTAIIHAHPHEIIYNVLNIDAAQFPPSKRAEVKQCQDKAPINMHAITGLENCNHTVKSNLENSPTIVVYDSESRQIFCAHQMQLTSAFRRSNYLQHSVVTR